MGEEIQILIVDDHTIVRQGLSRLLDEHPGLKVVGQASDGQKAVEEALRLSPEVIIMDIALPKMNGIEAVKRIRKSLPKTKILILSMYSHEHYIHQLMEAGVSGYLLKDDSGGDIIRAIHSALKDETPLNPAISKVLVASYQSPGKRKSRSERYKHLTNREREVLQLIAEGHSTRQIADMLFVSTSTVKSHRAHLMEKLDLDSSVKLIHFAIQLGLVDPEIWPPVDAT